MSNIAGKAYAMNLLTPIRGGMVILNKFLFWLVGTPLFRSKLQGLQTLSMIHYARWVIVRASEFPRLDPSQNPEKVSYAYMLFFSNFNGSWEQYVDSFSAAIPSGLNLLWFKNVGWPTSVPEQPFHRYVLRNQISTDYYYSAYPMAASNDVKSAQRVRDALCSFVASAAQTSSDEFLARYHALLKGLQNDLSPVAASPIVSLASATIAERRQAAHSGQDPPVHPGPRPTSDTPAPPRSPPLEHIHQGSDHAE
jgi:hypothetical protein